MAFQRYEWKVRVRDPFESSIPYMLELLKSQPEPERYKGRLPRCLEATLRAFQPKRY